METGRKLQIILIEDELGSRIRSFSLMKKPLVLSLLLFALFVVVVTIYAVFVTAGFLRHYAKTSKEIGELRSALRELRLENKELKLRVTALEKEKEETIEELARRIEIIDSLMKKVGVKPSGGEGGLALPLDKLLKNSNVDFSMVIPDIDYLIENFKTTPLGYPTYGRITSGFGVRRNPITGRLEFHLGVDIANSWGTPVRAPADGTVIKAGWCGLMGKCIEIRHNRDFLTYYGHLASLFVAKGDKVERGQIIGLMGSSGRSTGPHLHYTIQFKGKIVNPNSFMEALDVEKETPGGDGGL